MPSNAALLAVKATFRRFLNLEERVIMTQAHAKLPDGRSFTYDIGSPFAPNWRQSIFEARYSYVRVSFSRVALSGPVEVVIGVPLDSLSEVSAQYRTAKQALGDLIDCLVSRDMDDVTIAKHMEEAIKRVWPDARTYFIEVGRGEGDEWVQVFEPKAHQE